MDFGGMGGGDGRWDMKDSANSFVQYELANEKSVDGKLSNSNPIAKLIKGIFIISLLISLYVFCSSGMEPIAAVFLAFVISTVLALLPIAALWLYFRYQARKVKNSNNKTS